MPAGRITVNCTCGANFTVEAKFAGKSGTCPKCRLPLMVPRGGSEVACPKCRVLNSADELFCVACGATLPTLSGPTAPVRSTPDTPTEVGLSSPVSAPTEVHDSADLRELARAPDAAPVQIRVGEGMTPVPSRPGARPAPPRPAKVEAPRPQPAPIKQEKTEVMRPEAAPPAEPPAAPAAPLAPRKTQVLRNKLADMDKPRRPLVLRLFVFLVLAGGAGTGAFYLGRSTFEPAIAKHRAAETEARKFQWPSGRLEEVRDKLRALVKPVDPANPRERLTPEEEALRRQIDDDYARLKKESQEAEKAADAAHARTQNWQLGFYGVIGLAGLVLGMLGWKLTG